MSTQPSFIPYTESKSAEDRIAYVKANPDKYMPKPQYDIIKELKESNKSIHDKLDLVMNEILAKK